MKVGRMMSGKLPRETSLTDGHFNLINSRVRHSRALASLATDEPRTGADALLLIRFASGEVWGYAIQAKRLCSHKRADVEVLTPRPHYPEIKHDVGGTLQYDLLLKACGPAGDLEDYVPLYLFFNELSPYFPSNGAPCRSVFPGDVGEFGCTVGRAEDVKRIADVRMGLKIGGGQARFRAELFAEVFRPWLCLLCNDRARSCGHDGGSSAGTGGGPSGGSSSGGGSYGPVPLPLLEDDSDVERGAHKRDPKFTPAPWPDPLPNPRPLHRDSEAGSLAFMLLEQATDTSERLPRETRAAIARLAKSVLAVDLAHESKRYPDV